jgi:hypothetical protein
MSEETVSTEEGSSIGPLLVPANADAPVAAPTPSNKRW